jgi:hypothetical protein
MAREDATPRAMAEGLSPNHGRLGHGRRRAVGSIQLAGLVRGPVAVVDKSQGLSLGHVRRGR